MARPPFRRSKTTWAGDEPTLTPQELAILDELGLMVDVPNLCRVSRRHRAADPTCRSTGVAAKLADHQRHLATHAHASVGLAPCRGRRRGPISQVLSATRPADLARLCSRPGAAWQRRRSDSDLLSNWRGEIVFLVLIAIGSILLVVLSVQAASTLSTAGLAPRSPGCAPFTPQSVYAGAQSLPGCLFQ